MGGVLTVLRKMGVMAFVSLAAAITKKIYQYFYKQTQN